MVATPPAHIVRNHCPPKSYSLKLRRGEEKRGPRSPLLEWEKGVEKGTRDHLRQWFVAVS